MPRFNYSLSEQDIAVLEKWGLHILGNAVLLKSPALEVITQLTLGGVARRQTNGAPPLQHQEQYAGALLYTVRRNSVTHDTETPPPSELGTRPATETTVAAAAQMLELSQRQVQNLCREGSLESRKVNNKWHISLADIYAYNAQRKRNEQLRQRQRAA